MENRVDCGEGVKAVRVNAEGGRGVVEDMMDVSGDLC